MELSGTVYRGGTQERIADATVKVSSNASSFQVLTDDDGDFAFEELQPGEWTLVAMEEEYFPSRQQKINLTGNSTGNSVYLARLTGESDQNAGYRFFRLILIIFTILLVLYVILHNLLPRTTEPVSLILGDQVATAIQQIGTIDKMSEEKALLDTVTQITTDLSTVLDTTTTLNTSDKELLRLAGIRLAEAFKADDKAGTLDQLVLLRKELMTPARKGFAVWNSYPWRLLEILLWGLAGGLVNKIIISGWYLRSQRFYREGIVMHVAHLVTTPILVLVSVLLLSLASIQITVAGSALTLDISNPNTMVVAAFLLGTVSWPLWNFIEGTARQITRQQS